MSRGELRVSCGCTPIYESEFDSDGGATPIEAVVDAIANASEVEPTELAPLYDALDPGALDRLFGEPAGDDTVLGFTVDEFNVFVRGDGQIRVCDATRSVEAAPVFERPAD